MNAQAKRPRIALYKSLPIVIVVLLAVVAKLAALQRADIIAELTNRMDQGSLAEATDAVRKLTAMAHPPIPLLVSAATSNELAIAEEAQMGISRLLRRAQRQVEAHRKERAVAALLTALAKELAARRQDFRYADYGWLSATTHQILNIAGQCDAKHTPLVALHCDEILTVTVTVATSSTTRVTAAEAALEPVEPTSTVPDEDAIPRDPRQALLERDLSAYTSERLAPPTPFTPPATDSGDTAPAEPATRGALLPAEEPIPPRTSESTPPKSEVEPPRRTEWSKPILRIISTTPAAMPAELPITPIPATSAQTESGRSDDLSALSSRDLLARWINVDGAPSEPMMRELSRRGFGRPERQLVEKLLSPDPRSRIELIDDVFAAPNTDARAWLLLLAEDTNADVRLSAVTIMATSSDPTLLEKAWQVTIRDRDPRVADLAEQIRHRQNDTLRR